MNFIGRMLRNELLSLSTIFFVLVPALNHVMVNHGAPDVSHFSISALTGGSIGSSLSGIASQASGAGMMLAQAGSGSNQLFINHGPIFLN